MKATGKARYWAAWIGLLTFLLMGFANLQGMVLCFEPDGSITLENAIGGACSDAFQGHQSFQVKVSEKVGLQTAHCKRCVDIPIGLEAKEHEEQGLRAFQSSVDIPLPAQSPAIQAGYLATATRQQLPQPPPLPPALHRFLGTIVLLI
jgi:hypothetical protein